MKKFYRVHYKILAPAILLLLFTVISVKAQVTIRGVVKDEKKVPVAYANISIFGTYEGTVTDDSGRFVLITKLTGTIKLGASCIGMETEFKEIELNGQNQEVKFQLKDAFASLSPVVITAGTFAASEQNKAELLKPRDIGTTAGTPGDIQATIESLPGTQRVGYTEGLFVRGGSGTESKYIMDGLIFPDAYYSHVPSLRQRGRLDPFLFSGTVFSAGGYSAQYGQALSSVLILNSRGIADSTFTGGGIHSYGGNIFHTQRWKNTSLYINASYNDLSIYHSLSRQNIHWLKSPLNQELKLVLRHKAGKNGLLKVYADASTTKLGIHFNQTPESDTTSNFDIRNIDMIINANYTQFFNDNRNSLYAGTSLSCNTDKINSVGSDMRQSDYLCQTKILFKHSFTNDVRLIAGGEYNHTGLYGRIDSLKSSVGDNLFALFTESEVTIKGKFALRIGLRSELSTYGDRANLAPRTSFAYKFSKSSQVSFSYGLFFQSPDNLTMLYNPSGLSSEKAEHFIANYQYQQNDRTLRIEAYYKQYDRLVTEYEPQLNTPGYAGYAKGFELFFRDRTTAPNLDYWVSYSYTDSRRKTIVPDETITPDYVSKHSLSMVAKYWISPIGLYFSTSYHFASPRVFTYSTSNNEIIRLDIPAYSSCDISISKPMRLFRKPALLFCSLQNIFGYNKLLGYVSIPTYMEPYKVYRSEKRTFFIGLFINMYNN